MKLFDSEWKVMEVLWQENDRTAKEISLRLADSTGWNKNTTYTVIKKCIDKGAIERRELNFVCHALISKQQAQTEASDLTKKQQIMFGARPHLHISGAMRLFLQLHQSRQRKKVCQKSVLTSLYLRVQHRA